MATILIVDDLSGNRKLLMALLRPQGHRLIEAADGSEGLAAARAERPDLVITDVLMPVMDGYELVRQLRLDPATIAIPVVFYTAHYGAREARALALSGGVSAVLTKPLGNTEVLTIVNRLLAGAPAMTMPPAAPLTTEFDREHLRLLTDKVSENATDLKIANARLRALVNITLEFASEEDIERRLHGVCASARDLFGATYVTLGILDRRDGTVLHVITSGTDAATGVRSGDAVAGILGAVVTDRRAVRGDNPGGDPAALDLPAIHPEVQAFLAAPIASSAHVYGWICLVGNEGRTFSEEDEHLVLALSGQVGRIYELEREILERKHAEAEIRHRAQLSALGATVGLALTDSSSLAAALQQCADGLVTHLGAALARIWILNEREGLLALQASAGRWTRVARPHDTVPIGQFTMQAIAQERTPHLTNTVDGDPRIIDQDWAREEGMVAFAGFPLIVDGRVVGAMALFARHALPDAVGPALASVADHLALGIERHRSTEALRTAEERTRFALQAAGVGVWDMDHTTGLLQWSGILQSQHGVPPGTFGGTFDAFMECIHPDDRGFVREAFETATASGADFSVQYRTIWPDGVVRWLSTAGRVHLGGDGKPVRGVGISLDVTDRRALEEQYQQAQKMEAIGRLAGGVAHDFNNVLAVILGYCELLLSDLDPDDPRQADMVEIQKAGMSAAGLTRQLLAFSRKQIVEPTLLDLNVVVTDMRAMLERLIGEDVRVVLGLWSEPTPVRADRGQMEQIILNLAVNARDAMSRGGTLTIQTANVELDERYAQAHRPVQPGSYVRLTVTDTGSGMTPRVQARLFEPFFTTKDLGKGTGIGLANLHATVTRSGGSVTVSSEIGKGTAFQVYFPRAASGGTDAAVPPPVSRPGARPHTVLVVEDADGLRELARKMLRQQGYNVLVAANAEEALKLFEKHGPVDVLLTDVVMPGASGPELARLLDPGRSALKVIYMSGYTDDAVAQHGVLGAEAAFLHKPFTAEALGRKLREALDV